MCGDQFEVKIVSLSTPSTLSRHPNLRAWHSDWHSVREVSLTDPSLDSSLATPAHLLCAPVYFSVLCLTFCFMPLSLCLRWEVVRELELAFPRYTPCLRGLQRWKVMQLRRLTCWMPILSFRDILPKYGNFYTYVHSCVHTHTHTHTNTKFSCFIKRNYWIQSWQAWAALKMKRISY